MKIHGSPLQIAGIPDIVGCYRGRFVALEAKRFGEKPTKLQSYVMGEITRAGGMTLVIYTADEALGIIDGIDGPQEAESPRS